MIAALALAAATSSGQNEIVLQHVSAFAEAASKHAPLPFVSNDLSFETVFDARTMTTGTQISRDEFVKMVSGCSVSAVSTSDTGAYVSLACPRDADHGDGGVSYNATLRDGLVMRIGLRIGNVVSVRQLDRR